MSKSREDESNPDRMSDSNDKYDDRIGGVSSSSFQNESRMEEDPSSAFDYEEDDDESESFDSPQEEAERHHWKQLADWITLEEKDRFEERFAEFLKFRKHPPRVGSPDVEKYNKLEADVYGWCFCKTEAIAAKMGTVYQDVGIQMEAVHRLLDWMADSRNAGVPCKPLFLKLIKMKLSSAREKMRGRVEGPMLEEPGESAPRPDTGPMLEEMRKFFGIVEPQIGVKSSLGTWIANRLSESASVDLWEVCVRTLEERLMKKMVGVGIDWLNLGHWLAATAEQVVEIEEAATINPRKSCKLTHRRIVGAIETYSCLKGFEKTTIKENTWSQWVRRAKLEIDRTAAEFFGASGGMGAQST